MDTENSGMRRRRADDHMIDPDGDASSVFTVEKDSPGVRRMEAMTSIWDHKGKIAFLCSLVIMTYFRMLAATLLSTYQSFALNEMKVAGKSGMIRTVRQVLTSASLPITAKLSDYVGRPFVIWMTVFFWIIGTAITATSHSLGQYIPGFLLYTLGHVAGNILSYALAIDTSSLRNRLFMNFMFVFPGIINVWSSGVVAKQVTDNVGWRWGVAMWAFLIPACASGLLVVFAWSSWKARRRGLYQGIPSSLQLLRSRKAWVHLFWVMDLAGLLLLAAALALILLPLSLGGGSAAKWATARVITPLVVGVLLLPCFAFWEIKFARHPIFPAFALKDRHVMVILLFNFLKNIGSSTRDAYMYFTLSVSFNQGTEGATRINILEGFASSLTLIPVAFIVRRYKVVKPLVVLGYAIQVAAQGMAWRFRGGYSRHELAGLIASEILDGIGAGLSAHPSLVAMQSKLGHDQALLVTSCWAVGSQAGSGIAAAISGAIWTNMLPGKLLEGLQNAGVANAAKIAKEVYGSPLTFVKKYKPYSVEREAVVNAYRDVWRLLCIPAVAIMGVAFLLTLLMDNVKLDERHSLRDAKEVEAESDDNLPPKPPVIDEKPKDKVATQA